MRTVFALMVSLCRSRSCEPSYSCTLVVSEAKQMRMRSVAPNKLRERQEVSPITDKVKVYGMSVEPKDRCIQCPDERNLKPCIEKP
jgi:hypothetical protein